MSRWLVHGNEKLQRLALYADGVHDVAATAILRALAGKPVPLQNLHRFKQLCAQRRNRRYQSGCRRV